jgi:hypothetical protein
MNQRLPPASAPPSDPPEDDPFRYGWRFVKRLLPDGTTDLERVPLTLEDVLHPQEDDIIPERPIQSLELEYLGPIFRDRAQRLRGGLVLVDCLVDRGAAGVRNHSPDLSLFEGVVRPPPLDIGTFRLRPSGGRCLLALEVASPHTRVNDAVHKVREYHQVKVPQYVLVDQEEDGGPRRLVDYRFRRRRFVPVPPDEHGRVRLDPLGLCLGLRDNRVVCYDADSGEELGDYPRVFAAWKAGAKARQAAERKARKAEKQARERTEALQAAEQRLRELEAELRRLRGEPPEGTSP